MIFRIFLSSYPYSLIAKMAIERRTVVLDVVDHYYEHKLQELFSRTMFHFSTEAPTSEDASSTVMGRKFPGDARVFQVLTEDLSKLGLNYIVVNRSIFDRAWILRQLFFKGVGKRRPFHIRRS